MLDNRTGRQWRSLQDTADAAQLLYDARKDYLAYRFCGAVTIITKKARADLAGRGCDDPAARSHGAKVAGRLCNGLCGTAFNGPIVKPYTFEDVVQTLNAVQSYDWAAFFHERLESTSPHAPLGGIENGGYKLVYDDQPSEIWRDHEIFDHLADLSYSIGVIVKEEGEIEDVKMNSAAQKAGVTPASRIIAVNGRRFNTELLREAITEAVKKTSPIEIIVEDAEFFKTFRIDYHGGERYPHLVRDEGKPDLLGAIAAPRTAGQGLALQ